MAKEAIHNMDTLKSENRISQLGHIARDSLFTDEKNPPEQPFRTWPCVNLVQLSWDSPHTSAHCPGYSIVLLIATIDSDNKTIDRTALIGTTTRRKMLK
jgi:hypothetical protein